MQWFLLGFPLWVAERLPIPITLRNNFMRYFHVEISCWTTTCDFHFSLRNVSWFLTNNVWKTFQRIFYRRTRPAMWMPMDWVLMKPKSYENWQMDSCNCFVPLQACCRWMCKITCQPVASLTCSVTGFAFGVPVCPVWSVLSCLGRVLLGVCVMPSQYKIF